MNSPLHDDEKGDLQANELKSTNCYDSSSKRMAAWRSFLSIGKTYWIPGECSSSSYDYCFAIGDLAVAGLMLHIVFSSIPTACLPLFPCLT